MKNKIAISLLAILFIAISFAKAQTPAAPPADFKPDQSVDYSKYEGMVKQYAAWYEKSSLGKDTALRAKIAGFLMAWITGAPNVTVSIGNVIEPILEEKNNIYTPDLLVAYMGGVTVYELNNPNDKNEANIEVAGLQAVLELAKNNTALLADSKAIKKFKGMSQDQLQQYVSDCLKKQSK